MRFRIRVSEPTGGLGIRSVLSIFVGPHRRSGRDNPIAVIKSEIAFVRSLSSQKERAASGLFVAEGEKLVGEMLASEFRVRKIFRCGEEDRSEAGSVDTERVSPEGDGANQRAEDADAGAGSGRAAPLSVVCRHGDGRFGARARRSAGPRQSGNDRPAGRLVRHSRHRLLGKHRRLFRIRKPFRRRWGPLPACGCTIPAAGIRSLPGAGGVGRNSGLRDVSWRGRTSTGRGAFRRTAFVVMGSEGNGISSGTARCVTRRLFIPPYPGERRPRPSR